MFVRVELPNGGVWLRRHEDTPEQAVFRSAWQTFMFTNCGDHRPGQSDRICAHCAAAALLDEAQVKIADGPNDPKWVNFVETIPGYYEYWERRIEEAQANAEVEDERC